MIFKINKVWWSFLGLVLLALGGCASLGEGGTQAVPVDDRSRGAEARVVAAHRPAASRPPAGTHRTYSQADTPVAEPEAAGSSYRSASVPANDLNPAVVALLNEANRASRDGELDHSSASLERALRIEPRNAWLWHRLALVRLFQRRYGEAESLAAKSNGLAAGNRRLQADNWKLIAQAREQVGDTAGAAAAAGRARRLLR